MTAHHANMGGVGENGVNWITEAIFGTTRLGTHLDALGHLRIRDRAYNRRRVGEIAPSAGVTALESLPEPPRRARSRPVTARLPVDDPARCLPSRA
jgi:hypothetical protein